MLVYTRSIVPIGPFFFAAVSYAAVCTNRCVAEEVVLKVRQSAAIRTQQESNPEDSSTDPWASDYPSDISPVLELNRFTFNKVVLNPTGAGAVHWMVVFCPDWWDPCRDIAPHFSEAASKYKTQLNVDLVANKVGFARVDCGADKYLCNDQAVEAYPTVLHFYGGVRVSEWTGGSKKDIPTLHKYLVNELQQASGTTDPVETKHLQDDAANSTTGLAFVVANFPYPRIVDIVLTLICVIAGIRLVTSG